MKKKILSLLLCLSMISVFVPAFAGSGIVAKIGNTEYTDYSKAWQQVQSNGGTIDVLADWLVNENLIVPALDELNINTTETDQIKAFLFKDLSAISPLCGSVSMNIVSGE